jgi:hypothetical protein
MKKLGLTFAAVGLFFATTAQAQEVAGIGVEVDAKVNATTSQVAELTDGFKKIALSDVPAVVTAAVEEEYDGATTKTAYVTEKEGKLIYKLELDAEGEQVNVYADAEGKLLEEDDVNEED